MGTKGGTCIKTRLGKWIAHLKNEIWLVNWHSQVKVIINKNLIFLFYSLM